MAAARLKLWSDGEKLLLGDYNNEIDNIYSNINNISGANVADGTISPAKFTDGANPEVFFGEIYKDRIVESGLAYTSDSGLTVTLTPGTAYILQTSTSPTKLVRVVKTLSTVIAVSASVTQYIDLKSNGSFVVTTSTTVTTDASRLLKVVTDASSVTSQSDLAKRVFGDDFANTFGEMKNVVLRSTSVTALQLEANFIILSEDGITQITSTSALTAAITSSGAGGLDQGAEATDAWYAVVLIADSTGVTAPNLLLVNQTNWAAGTEIIPTGYDKKRRISYVRNTSGDFVEFQQVDNRVTYYEPERLSSALSSASFTDLSCNNFVAPSARTVNLSIFSTMGDNSERSMYVSEAGSSGSSGGVRVHHFRVDDSFSSSSSLHAGSTAYDIMLDIAFDFAARTVNSIDEVDIMGYIDRLQD